MEHFHHPDCSLAHTPGPEGCPVNRTKCSKCGRSDHELADSLADGSMCETPDSLRFYREKDESMRIDSDTLLSGRQAWITHTNTSAVVLLGPGPDSPRWSFVCSDTGRDKPVITQGSTPQVALVRFHEEWDDMPESLAVALNALVSAAGTVFQAIDEMDPFSTRTDALANADLDQRPMYAWVVEGDVSTGSLTRYAKDVEYGHYAGIEVGTTLTTLTAGPDRVDARHVTPDQVHQGTGEDYEGYATYRHLRIVVRERDVIHRDESTSPGKIIDAADYRIDLRA